uniref:(northern house mosquito) hypothetical protein n=1 Tax=Culex pipiens TaxID=7175 RepID=A0A8D8BN63_CULPI
MAIAASLSCSSISQGFKRAYSGMSSVQPIHLYKPRGSISLRCSRVCRQAHIAGLGVRFNSVKATQNSQQCPELTSNPGLTQYFAAEAISNKRLGLEDGEEAKMLHLTTVFCH